MTQSLEKTAVLLIAHGSRQAAANDDLHELAARLAGRGEYPIVVASFLELAEPDIAVGGERCVSMGASRVLMVPYFLSSGVHLVRDLTAARDELGRSHPQVEFKLGPALGPHPLLDELVAERVRQTDTAAAPPIALSPGETESCTPIAASGLRHDGSDSEDRSGGIDTNRPKG